MNTEAIAENLLNVFEGNNWTEVSILETIKDLSWQEAYTKTIASPNTIASLLHHLAYWNDIIFERMQGGDPEIPAANGFDVPPANNESDWKALVEKAHQSFQKLAAAIRQFPPDRLGNTTAHGQSTMGKNIYGIVEHAYYHLGQMVIIKHLL